MNFGEKLKALRENKGMTINQLALYSGISAAAISRIETGKRGTPKIQNIRKLAVALKVPYHELLPMAEYIPDLQIHEHELNTIDLQILSAVKELSEEKKKFLLEVIKQINSK